MIAVFHGNREDRRQLFLLIENDIIKIQMGRYRLG